MVGRRRARAVSAAVSRRSARSIVKGRTGRSVLDHLNADVNVLELVADVHAKADIKSHLPVPVAVGT